MVVFHDLDEEDGSLDDPTIAAHTRDAFSARPIVQSPEAFVERRPNANLDLFSAALQCYPVVSQLASFLDLNSLHELSATCHQIRASLLQFRGQLVRQTIRCSNEDLDVGPRLADRMRDAHYAWRRGALSERITSGRVGRCARDMVGECRKCGIIICRNCTVKPPPQKNLLDRHRRLCRTCMKAPLRFHLSMVEPLEYNPNAEPSFTREAFTRGPCICPDMVFLCHTCGNGLRSADITYMRGWTWRTRYSTYLGGLGTGIGEGNEGVECGKGDACLAAREVEKEIDCDAEELADMKREMDKAAEEGRKWGGTSYLAQEIEGIGGVVKKKVKKRVKLGMVVKEYEDERENREDYLLREQKRLNRSFCSWCARIVPGIKDSDTRAREIGLAKELPSSSASSTKSQLMD